MNFIDSVTPGDKPRIKKLLEESGFFYPFEVDVVMELIDVTTAAQNDSSGYYWIILEENGKILGFANFGPNPCSVHSWDLYWLAIDTSLKNKGLGSLLLQKTEERVIREGGRIVWAETSGRSLYQPTVAFYHKKGYTLNATLDEFYGPGDPKLIFSKKLG